MAFDIEAMRNKFYYTKRDGFNSLIIISEEKVDKSNKEDLINLAKVYGLKIKFKVKKGVGSYGRFKAKIH